MSSKNGEIGGGSSRTTPRRIEAKIGDFNLSLDPASLDRDSAERAREALPSALAALETDPDLTDAN